MMFFKKIQEKLFKVRRAIAILVFVAGAFYLRTYSLYAGFIIVTFVPVFLWSMKLHPDADTDHAPFAARKGVRISYTVACIVGLIALLCLAVFYSGKHSSIKIR